MHRRHRFLVLLLTIGLVGLLAPPATAQFDGDDDPLEEYEFELGASPAQLLFEDPAVGNGNARLRLELEPGRAGSFDVRLEIFRHVPRGIITFALLVERVEIVFRNERGLRLRRLILANPDDGLLFTIGDSDDGYFRHEDRVRRLVATREVEVRIFGNYE